MAFLNTIISPVHKVNESVKRAYAYLNLTGKDSVSSSKDSKPLESTPSFRAPTEKDQIFEEIKNLLDNF